jgi:hypothetical protein
MLLAFCLVAPMWAQELKLDWAVYGEQNSKPELGRVEIKQGDRLRFHIASNHLNRGSFYPLPYTKPLAHVEWTVQPPTAGISVLADGTVIVSDMAHPGKYEIATSMLAVFCERETKFKFVLKKATRFRSSARSSISIPIQPHFFKSSVELVLPSVFWL